MAPLRLSFLLGLGAGYVRGMWHRLQRSIHPWDPRRPLQPGERASFQGQARIPFDVEASRLEMAHDPGAAIEVVELIPDARPFARFCWVTIVNAGNAPANVAVAMRAVGEDGRTYLMLLNRMRPAEPLN